MLLHVRRPQGFAVALPLLTLCRSAQVSAAPRLSHRATLYIANVADGRPALSAERHVLVQPAGRLVRLHDPAIAAGWRRSRRLWSGSRARPAAAYLSVMG